MPIIIPTHYEEEVCPQCKKEEDRAEICNHCGYKYPEEEGTSWYEYVVGSGIILIALWGIVTVILWLAESMASYDPPTLIEVIKAQYEFITSLKIY